MDNCLKCVIRAEEDLWLVFYHCQLVDNVFAMIACPILLEYVIGVFTNSWDPHTLPRHFTSLKDILIWHICHC